MSLIMGTAGVGASAGILVPWLTHPNTTEEVSEQENDDKSTDSEEEIESIEEEQIEEGKKDEEQQPSEGEDGEETELDAKEPIKEEVEEQEGEDDSEKPHDDRQDEAETEEEIDGTEQQGSGSSPQNQQQAQISSSETPPTLNTPTPPATNQDANGLSMKQKLKTGVVKYGFLKFTSQNECDTEWKTPAGKFECKVLAKHKTNSDSYWGFVSVSDTNTLPAQLKPLFVFIHNKAKASDLGSEQWEDIPSSK